MCLMSLKICENMNFGSCIIVWKVEIGMYIFFSLRAESSTSNWFFKNKFPITDFPNLSIIKINFAIIQSKCLTLGN